MTPSLAHRDPSETQQCTAEVRGREPDTREGEEDPDEDQSRGTGHCLTDRDYSEDQTHTQHYLKIVAQLPILHINCAWLISFRVHIFLINPLLSLCRIP